MGLFKPPSAPALPPMPAAPPPPPAFGQIQGEKPGRKSQAPTFLGADTMVAGSPSSMSTFMGGASAGPTGQKSLLGQ